MPAYNYILCNYKQKTGTRTGAWGEHDNAETTGEGAEENRAETNPTT